MEYGAISPSDNCAGEWAMWETITRNEKDGVGREKPDADKVDDINIVTEVKEEVVPGSLLVSDETEGYEV
jgi:hypothetical protein